MKQPFTMIFLVIMLTVLCGGFLPAQAEDPEEEDEGPVQSRPNPMAWITLKEQASFTSLQITRGRGHPYRIHMRAIRLALEKAGVNEKIVIMLKLKNGKNIQLGTFDPVPVRLKRSQVADDGEHGDSAGRPRFESIGNRLNLSWDPTDFRGKRLAGVQLLFLNAGLEVKASFNVELVFR